MKEYGGYLELERNRMPMLHENAVALNCGRNAFWYLCLAKNIRKLVLPKFLCDSVVAVCKKAGMEYRFYSIGTDFLPKNIEIKQDEWLYIVNYYGQINNGIISRLKMQYVRLIVDNAQAYFQMPVDGVDTFYTCRKFFGVPDGAFLYTNELLIKDFPQDESYERMHFLLGRFERPASEFYSEYVANNLLFENEPIKWMSNLTDNLLRGIDYDFVKTQRTENYKALHGILKDRNKLTLTAPSGAFMYPFYIENGAKIREELKKKKIYIPTLWPDVFVFSKAGELEFDMAMNILPLPTDQRYTINDMEYIVKSILQVIGE